MSATKNAVRRVFGRVTDWLQAIKAPAEPSPSQEPGEPPPHQPTGNAHAVGIDLGTTLSAAAYLSDTGQTTMIRNGDGELLTPSVVLFNSDKVVIGAEAKKMAVLQLEHVAERVKRDMGSKTYSRRIHGKGMPPEVIQAYILKQLKKEITATLGSNFKVVITVPAYFDEPRRQATVDAGQMAGLDVLDIINEPTAAALAFGEHLGYLAPSGSPREEMNILVYDLGGGTFDVTIMQLKPGDIRALATDGDVRLGGHDWDERLVKQLGEAFREQHGLDLREDRTRCAELVHAAEQVKHALSLRPHAAVPLEYAGHSCSVPITRAQFEELTADLLERTAYTTRQVLAAARMQWDNIDRVLLVGGSTRMPMVARMLEELSGITPDHSVNPDEAVARGAALYAGYLMSSVGDAAGKQRFKVVNVNAHSLGIAGTDLKTGIRENAVLIPRNTPLPVTKGRQCVTKKHGQTSVAITVLEGESSDPASCITVGRAILPELPPDLPKGHPVEVKYRYGSNGRLQVQARVPGTGRALNVEFQRTHALSSQRILQWETVVRSGNGYAVFEQMVDDVLFDREDS